MSKTQVRIKTQENNVQPVDKGFPLIEAIITEASKSPKLAQLMRELVGVRVNSKTPKAGMGGPVVPEEFVPKPEGIYYGYWMRDGHFYKCVYKSTEKDGYLVQWGDTLKIEKTPVLKERPGKNAPMTKALGPVTIG